MATATPNFYYWFPFVTKYDDDLDIKTNGMGDLPTGELIKIRTMTKSRRFKIFLDYF
jgi:hypothetical protein